jgi:BirA family transcriptional regulator, biotin operon repressor / biotin---[acetyl-CoA-carboxylase] ligase
LCVSRQLASYRRPQGWLGHDVRYFLKVTSTHDVIRELVEQEAEEGLVVLAEEQTAGRGRKTRRWVAPPNTSLLVSLLFRPQTPFAYRAPRITMLCGLGLLETVRDITGVPVMLKWPNDLIVERDGDWKKVAGMLSEVGGADADFLLVGVGLNVNIAGEQLSDLAPRATSLMAEAGHLVDREALLSSFLERTECLCERFRSGWDPLPAWRDWLAWMGRSVKVTTPTETVWGIAEDIADDGALIVREFSGGRRHFSVGDVSLRRSADTSPVS